MDNVQTLWSLVWMRWNALFKWHALSPQKWMSQQVWNLSVCWGHHDRRWVGGICTAPRVEARHRASEIDSGTQAASDLWVLSCSSLPPRNDGRHGCCSTSLHKIEHRPTNSPLQRRIEQTYCSSCKDSQWFRPSYKFSHLNNIYFPSLDTLTLSNVITFVHSILKIKTSTIQVYISRINIFAKLSSGAPYLAFSLSHISMFKGLQKICPSLQTSLTILSKFSTSVCKG